MIIPPPSLIVCRNGGGCQDASLLSEIAPSPYPFRRPLHARIVTLDLFSGSGRDRTGKALSSPGPPPTIGISATGGLDPDADDTQDGCDHSKHAGDNPHLG